MSHEEFLELFFELTQSIAKDAGYDPVGREIDVCLQSPTATPISLAQAAS
jgi:hypothetical protein